MKKKLLPLLLASAMFALPVTSEAASTGVWTGLDLGPDAYFVYLGGVTALSHEDILTQDGWLARIDLGYGEYEYDTSGIPGGVDGDVFNGDVMVGYRHFFGNGSLTGYLGGEWSHHHLDPNDPLNSVDGSEGGVKGLVELNAEVMPKVPVGLSGSYSSAFDSYRVRGTVGYNFGNFVLGPEAVDQGNEEWHQFRVGGVLSNFDLGFADAKAYVGYAANSGHGDDGAYGGVGFSKNF